MHLGLIGYPLGHSFSERYFTEKFKKEGINARYSNFETKDLSELEKIIKEYPDLVGFNVTSPYKQKIIPLLDKISKEAKYCGSVNCVKIERKGEKFILHGYNTDITGFQYALERFIPSLSMRALILGSGGAAYAVKWVLERKNIQAFFVSRAPDKKTSIGYNNIYHYLPDYKLIINATPLGMLHQQDTFPDIPYKQLGPDHYLFDLIYNPSKTLFLQKGELQGAHIKNGMEMLIEQAEEAWKIWTNPDYSETDNWVI